MPGKLMKLYHVLREFRARNRVFWEPLSPRITDLGSGRKLNLQARRFRHRLPQKRNLCCADAAYPFTRWIEGNLGFDGRGRARGRATLRLGHRRGVRQSWRANFLRHLRILDYHAASQRTQHNRDYFAARFLCSPGISHSAGSYGLHADCVRHLLARLALISHEVCEVCCVVS